MTETTWAAIKNAILCCVIVQDSASEPEEFTAELQKVLKSSPQPYLVPFLKVRNVDVLYKLLQMVNVST